MTEGESWGRAGVGDKERRELERMINSALCFREQNKQES